MANFGIMTLGDDETYANRVRFQVEDPAVLSLRTGDNSDKAGIRVGAARVDRIYFPDGTTQATAPADPTTASIFTVTTALILGAATTSGVRLVLESGVLAVREGDDSAYAPLRVFSLGVGTGTSANSGDINCSQITASSWFNGNGTGAFLGPLLYQGSYTSSQSVAHASSGRVIHNASASGDIEITLPAMAGKGSFFVVFVGSANYLKITANAADKIRNGATASVSGGYIRSNTVGSAMLLVGTGTSGWSVIGPTGTWTIDS